MIVQDHLNRQIDIQKEPQRIISLVPSITELLYDLGLGDRIVGITKFCIHPDNWYRNKPRIGGTKTLNFEAIKALNPDFIIANKEENTESEIKTLMADYCVFVSDINSIMDAKRFIQELGPILGVEKEVRELLTEIEKSIQLIPDFSALNVQYLIWQKPFMGVGKETFIDDVIRLIGWNNLSGKDRYPELSLEELNDEKLDLVLLSSEPFPFKEKHQKSLEEMGLKTPTFLVDGEVFSWYGSRMKEMGRYFQELHQLVDKEVG